MVTLISLCSIVLPAVIFLPMLLVGVFYHQPVKIHGKYQAASGYSEDGGYCC